MNLSVVLGSVLAVTLGMTLGAAAQTTPDFSGVWKASSAITALRTTQGQLPPLTPEGQKLYAQHVAQRKAGDLSFDTTTKCQPPGVPRAYFMGMPFEVQQEARFVNVLFQFNRLFRVAELNVSHDQLNMYAPTFFGFATASWDQNTLVMDSRLHNDVTLLDSAGLPHSMDMKLVERWDLSKDGQRINATFTVDDPQYYREPWNFKATFTRQPAGTEIAEDVCLERVGAVKRPGR